MSAGFAPPEAAGKDDRPGRPSAGIDHEVVIVGAGFSGIGVAISLAKAGIDDFLIVESGDALRRDVAVEHLSGRRGRHPVVQLPVLVREAHGLVARVRAREPSCARTPSTAPRSTGCTARTRFGTRIDGATFDEDRHVWRLVTDGGEELVARHVVDATGVLTHPKRPDIPGVEDFAGTLLHTARWDHSQDLRGKRVAVIGTGASAVQVIPAIAHEVEHLTVFQRTPIWCLPKYDAPLSPRVRSAAGPRSRQRRRWPGS